MDTCTHRCAPRCHKHIVLGPRQQVLEASHPLLQGFVLLVQELAARTKCSNSNQPHQPLRVAHRQWPQEKRIHQAEDHSVRGYSEGQQGNDSGGEQRTLREETPRKSQIKPHMEYYRRVVSPPETLGEETRLNRSARSRLIAEARQWHGVGWYRQPRADARYGH